MSPDLGRTAGKPCLLDMSRLWRPEQNLDGEGLMSPSPGGGAKYQQLMAVDSFSSEV